MTDFPRLVVEGGYRETVLAKSPVAYWRLDDAGASAIDSSGNTNTGTVQSGVTTGATGALTATANAAMSFNGSSGYITVADSASLNFTSLSFTVEAWIYLTGTGTSGYCPIISHPGGADNKHYILTDPSRILYRWTGFSSGYTVPLNTWKYIVYTFAAVSDTNGTETFYVDGSSVATRTGIVPAFPAATVWGIGSQANGLNHWFQGSIDEVALYATALSPSVITSHWNAASASGPYADVVTRAYGRVKSVTDTLTAAVDAIGISRGINKAIADTLTAATATAVAVFGRTRAVADTLTAATDSATRLINGFRNFNATVTPSGSVGKLIKRIVAVATLVPAAVILHSDAFWTYVTAHLVVHYRGFNIQLAGRALALVTVFRAFNLSLVKTETVSTLDTVPDSIELAIGEQVPVNIDTTNVLLTGETIQTSPIPTAVVTSYTNNVVIAGAINGAVTINGNLLQVVLVGSVLKKGQSYYLIVTFNTSAVKKLNVRTRMDVVF